MTLLGWIRSVYQDLRGDRIDEMLSELHEETRQTKRRVDEVYREMTLNGEDTWGRSTGCHDRK